MERGTESKSAEKLFSCDVCDFSETSRKDLNIHMIKQHKDLEQLDGNISLNSAVVDEQKLEMPTEPTLNECITCYEFVSQGHPAMSM